MRILIAISLAVFLAGCVTTYVGLKVKKDNKYVCCKVSGTCTTTEDGFTAEWKINPQSDGTAEIDGKIKANFNDVGQYRDASITILSIKDGVVVGEKSIVVHSGDLARGIPFSSKISSGFDSTAVTYSFGYR